MEKKNLHSCYQCAAQRLLRTKFCVVFWSGKIFCCYKWTAKNFVNKLNLVGLLQQNMHMIYEVDGHSLLVWHLSGG